MSPTALLLSVFFLCGLEETVLSQRGLCAGNQCFAVFQKPADFAGAQEACKNKSGQILTHDGDTMKSIAPLLSNSGRYWLELRSTIRSAAGETLQNCDSLYSLTGKEVSLVEKPCHSTLDGFLCQFIIEEPCTGLQAGGGAQVEYTAPMNFEVDGSGTFPQGTIAETGTAKYPDSRHVCFSRSWIKAPWTCEVMDGGCGHKCISKTNTCTCPEGKILHPNNIDCIPGPCESNPCTGEGEECKTTEDGFRCTCIDGFIEEDGVCVNVTVCDNCEHMLCDKFNGVYQCMCRKGFKVADHNPSKCVVICTGRDCPASCIKDQCFCPKGYIKDVPPGNHSVPICTDINECDYNNCDQNCENTFGGYKCSCNENFQLLRDGSTCVPIEKDEEDGSGSTPTYPTPGGAHPAAAVPSYVKTGSVLGITVFMALCAALLFFLIRNASKRCGKFELSSIKHTDINIFHLQQVTTETYKSLKNDS